MYLFIGLNFCMAFVLQDTPAMRNFFLADFMGYFGGALLAVNFFAACIDFKKIGFKLRYDLFAVGALLVWFSFWPDFFREGSPLFYLYPMYFALITALFSLLFIRKREFIDPDALHVLQWLSDSGRFNPLIIMLSVIVSLFLPQQFMLFPLTLSLLVMRYTLACCLDNE